MIDATASLRRDHLRGALTAAFAILALAPQT